MTDHHHSKESGEALSAWLRAHPDQGNIRELGKKLGIGYSALRHYFAGHNFPRGEALEKLRLATRLAILEQTPPRRSSVSTRAAVQGQRRGRGAEGANSAGHRTVSENYESDPRRVKLIVALRTWIGQHPELGRLGLARRLGVSESTVQEWVTGRYYPKPQMQVALADATGIEFGPYGPSPPAGGRTPPVMSTGVEAELAAEALLQVLRALAPVVHGPPARRKALQQAFSRESAGYLTAAVTALYSSEEDFQTWKYFAHPQTEDSR